MTEAHAAAEAEVLERHGYQIRLSPSGLEWMAFVARPWRGADLRAAPVRLA